MLAFSTAGEFTTDTIRHQETTKSKQKIALLSLVCNAVYLKLSRRLYSYLLINSSIYGYI